jgi:predicted CxxxxCH...CXXCH cytochrome family protein
MPDCARCHAETVDENNTVHDPLRHVDGIVDVDFDSACTSCHGEANPAPADAHQTHLLGSAISRAVPCAECHLVPDEVLDPGHDDSAPPAELTFSGAAVAFGAQPSYAGGVCANTACHGAVFPEGNDSGGLNTVPEWARVDGSQATCGSCHGLPPPAPHPYYSEDCSSCHENVAADDQSFVRPDLHVDGVVTFTLP